MAELDEIEVISKAGIPLYFHSNSGRTQDDTYMLQASFITALSQFADELDNGEVKQISMERKDYLLTKTSDFTLIFASNASDPVFVQEYQPKIYEVKEYLNTKIDQLGVDITSPNPSGLDGTLSDFDEYLRHQQLVKGQEYNSLSFRRGVSSLVFRSVGYEPGKCNIGPAERMRRLSFGLTAFVMSALLFAIVILLGLPSYLVFILVIPNFLGFLGLFQYFYRFCTTNAMKHTYDMN